MRCRGAASEEQGKQRGYVIFEANIFKKVIHEGGK